MQTSAYGLFVPRRLSVFLLGNTLEGLNGEERGYMSVKISLEK